MGYMGPGLPGQRSALVAEDRRFTEELWGLPRGTISAEAGAGTVELFSRMASGQIINIARILNSQFTPHLVSCNLGCSQRARAR